MKTLPIYLIACSLIVLTAVLLVRPEFAATQVQSAAPVQNSAAATEDIPAYHAQPPSGALPPTLAPSLFNNTIVFNAYAAAAHVEKVLYQQPCYCHCDRSQGHGSLLDCFVSRHGSGCGTCIKEVFYTYEQTRRGKTPAQIRDGILHGEWQKVDLAKYEKDTIPAK
jgi:hypothetical protein